MKILNGEELAGYIAMQQAQRVRSLKQAKNKYPKLEVPSSIISKYPGINQYAKDIGVELTSIKAKNDELLSEACVKAIEWLLAGYNVNLAGIQIVVLGSSPAEALLVNRWQVSGFNVSDTMLDEGVENYEFVDLLIDLQQSLKSVPLNILSEKAVIVGANVNSEIESMKKVSYASNSDLDPLIIAAILDSALI